MKTKQVMKKKNWSDADGRQGSDSGNNEEWMAVVVVSSKNKNNATSFR